MLEKFAHVFPAMVTPMKEDGSFNYEVAKKHADWMMDNGIGGIGVLCPEKRGTISRLVFRSMIAGVFVSLMSALIVSMVTLF